MLNESSEVLKCCINCKIIFLSCNIFFDWKTNCMLMDDKTLIKKILYGDRSAISLLVENNKNLVWHIIISMVGHTSDCEDLFQEVFLQVFKGLKRFRADARLSTWVGSIAHHVCVDYIRKKKKESDFQNRDTNDELAINFLPDMNWKQAEREDLNRVVLIAINKLPATYRTPIILYHLDECSYREIADITGMPDGTLKSYISRGRNLLREILIKLVPDIVGILDDL
jgi:RNA polymerase sigma factor (sigma-70 family)